MEFKGKIYKFDYLYDFSFFFLVKVLLLEV